MATEDDKRRVKLLSNALKWEKYAEGIPDWYFPKATEGLKGRTKAGQAASVAGHLTKALREKE